MTRLSRRRLLTIAACLPFAAHAGQQRLEWQGRAFGADIRITLKGPPEVTRPALARARLEIDAYERRFSLFRGDSDLVALNESGRLAEPDPVWRALLAQCDQLHRVTGGVFDPTIQPLWQALARGGDVGQARALVGWDRVGLPGAGQRSLRLGPGQALSFNGIAQGAATEAVRRALRSAGMGSVLIDIGETAALGGPWQIGVVDPAHGAVARLALTDMALAVSSPAALLLAGGETHILDPQRLRAPRWSSVAVLAEDAARADGLSTAACLMSASDAKRAARALGGIRRLLMIAPDGTSVDQVL